jgi:hypothetical protein
MMFDSPGRLPAWASRLIGLPCGIIILSLIILVTSGCMSAIQFGKPPLTDRLDSLKINVSTIQDVKAVLGEPQGRGAVRSPSFGVKEVWLYESTKVEGMTKSRMRMLMVFLDKEQGVYHGHLWFASGMLLSQTK